MSQDDVGVAQVVMFKLVEKQLRSGTPRETRATLERLRCQGYSRAEAVHRIAAVLANEIYKVMAHEDSRFDNASYVAALGRLPALPWE